MKEEKQYAIYGAGVVGYQIYLAIREIYGISPQCFWVTSVADNQVEIDGIPVRGIETMDETDKDVPIVIATPEIYHTQIIQILSDKGVGKYYCITSQKEYKIMSQYFKQKSDLLLLEDLKTRKVCDENVDGQFQVYMAKSQKDVPLSQTYEMPDWIIPVLAGSSMTEKCGINLRDDEGENISYKNANYCELTVAYWLWKNRCSTYKGLCHYRRILELSRAELQACLENDVDMILPLPFVCYPDATAQYKRYISETDLKGLRMAIQDISPEYIEVWDNLDRQPFFYNYNMLIAKDDVYNSYCEWLFMVLERAEFYCEPSGIKRADRYAGYLGELLTTLYIMKNKERYRIVHAEKIWLV